MKKFTKTKTIIVASILLVAGIITSHATAYMGGANHMGNGSNMMNGNHMGYGSGYGMMDNGYMMENLSAEDQAKMLDQMNSFFSSIRDIREQQYQKQLELNAEYAKPEKDQVKIEALQKQVFDLSSQFEKQRFDHMVTMNRFFADKNTGSATGMGNGYNSCF